MQYVIRRTTYSDLDLEQKFEATKKSKAALLEVTGKHHGLENKPHSQRHYLIEIFEPLRSDLQGLLEFNYTKHQPYSSIAYAKTNRTDAGKEVALLDVKGKNLEKKISLTENEAAVYKASFFKLLVYKVKIAIPLLLGVAETVILFNLLENSSLPFFMAIFISIAAGFVSAVGMNMAARYIKRAISAQQQVQRYRLVLLVAFVVSIVLGVCRFELFTAARTINDQIEMQSVAPASRAIVIPFILLGFGMFWVSLVFELRVRYSKEEVKNLEAYIQLKEKIRALKMELAQVDLEKKNINASSKDITNHTIQKQEYAMSFENRVVSLADELQRLYESTNLEHRQDASCPDYFGQPYPWDFKLYFNHFFKPQNEN